MDDFLLMDVDVFCPEGMVEVCGCNTEMENTCSSKGTQLLTLENVFLPIVPTLFFLKMTPAATTSLQQLPGLSEVSSHRYCLQNKDQKGIQAMVPTS